MALTRDIAQLLLQVDASVALAQRNLNQLAQSVDADTNRMDQMLGRVDKAYSRMNNSAAASAKVFIEQRKAADDLIGSIDPLYAAQMRYDRELERAALLQRNGSLTAGEFAKVQAGLKAQLDDQVLAFGGLTKGVGTARLAQMEMLHVVRGSVDQFAAGASTTQIFAMHIGMLGQAAALGGSSMGKFGEIMGGPWGIAIIAGISILSTLISKHHETAASVDELIDKMRKQHAEALSQNTANAIWARSLDGVREAQAKLRKELEESLKVEAAVQLNARDQAAKDLSLQRLALQKEERQLAGLKGQRTVAVQAAANPLQTVDDAGAAQSKVDALDRKIRASEARISTLKAAVADQTKILSERQIAVGEAAGKAVDDLGAKAQRWADIYTAALRTIEQKNPQLAAASAEITTGFEAVRRATSDAASAGIGFDSTIDKAKRLGIELGQGKITAGQYASAMKGIAAALEGAARAAQDAKKGTGELGKQISFDAAASIAKDAGLTVTSGYRQQFGHGTPGHATQEDLYNNPAYNHPGNPVAKPGSSAHGGANGKWALDIAFAPGLTANKLKKLYGDQGVSLSAVYKESGHFHIEGSRSRAAAEETSAARAQQKQQVDDDQFARESAQIDAETLNARRQLVAGYDTQADLAAEEVEAQRKARVADIQKQLDAGRITAEQAKTLTIQADDAAAAQAAVIARRKLADGLEQQAKLIQQGLGFQVDDLKFADEVATTQAEHRRIQLAILDITYQQKEAELRYLQAQIQRNKDFATSVDLQNQNRLIQGQLDRLPTEKAQDQQRIRQGTLNPLEEWAKTVPQTADEITAAIQGIEARGLDGLANAIGEIVMGTKSMGEAFSDVAKSIIGEIAQMVIKMLLFRALSSIFGSAFGGASFSTAAGGDALERNAKGNAFSGGNVIPFARGGVVHGPTLFRMGNGGTGLMGEAGSEAIMPLSRDSRGRLGVRMSMPTVPRIGFPSGPAAQPAAASVEITVLPSGDFDVRVAQVANAVVDVKTPGIVNTAGMAVIKAASRPRLMGGR
jgi:lambda family phage tail tape measure protein